MNIYQPDDDALAREIKSLQYQIEIQTVEIEGLHDRIDAMVDCIDALKRIVSRYVDLID